MEISGSGAASNSVALRELKAPDPKLLGTVEVIVGTIADCTAASIRWSTSGCMERLSCTLSGPEYP